MGFKTQINLKGKASEEILNVVWKGIPGIGFNGSDPECKFQLRKSEQTSKLYKSKFKALKREMENKGYVTTMIRI